MSESMRAYSLGYEGITLGQCLEILSLNKISIVVDVREIPWSYKPGFSKKPLSEALGATGISYIHMKSAGNPSRNRKQGLPQAEVIELYKEHLAEHSMCLAEILNLISGSGGSERVCLLCFEKNPHDCHRKVLLDVLAEHTGELISCHLHGEVQTSKKLIASPRIPKPDHRKRTRKHVEVAEDECGPVLFQV